MAPTTETLIESYRRFVAGEGETLGRLLFWAERAVVERSLERLRRAGHDDVSFAQLQLVQQLCLEGTRIGDLAERMRMSHQAVGQLVDALERRGLVRREPDPADRRAKVVVYTDDGRRLVADAIDVTLSVEREIAKRIGRGRLADLKDALSILSDADGGGGGRAS